MTGLVTAYRTFQVQIWSRQLFCVNVNGVTLPCDFVNDLVVGRSGLEPNLDFEIARLCTHVLISQRRKIYC
ncbi:uncharacterized protein OCT59_025947 [Rhizophagus irregularis]|uniref:Uncharacterized protein n=1 Tax=Rhizophagus irregularis TaxID=588596 RepID=A0A915YXM1_9GLOM|nr:hypothetical protein OCT59_025947 [Rhizophagus irregularis]GBC12348.2 hypothetical protein RIR_jg3594.t1 [Rhizophagus irregularis DAOM 181602=DAOM 197198]CAB5350149.1 unnamed protein product [Rhizophagus irregularis]